MSLYLESNTILNKTINIENVIFYDEKSKKEIIAISGDSIRDKMKTNTLNAIYNTMQLSNIYVDKIFIENVKRKNKIDYSEKQAYYITNSYDNKYYYEYNVNLYLNTNYFESIEIKENSFNKCMYAGMYYYYDDINIKLKEKYTKLYNI